MSDEPIVHAFDDAGRVVQHGLEVAASLKDKAIAKLHEMPVSATEEHIIHELSAVFEQHWAENAPAAAPVVEGAPAAPAAPASEPPAQG